jgi:hypothetical protein
MSIEQQRFHSRMKQKSHTWNVCPHLSSQTAKLKINQLNILFAAFSKHEGTGIAQSVL